MACSVGFPHLIIGTKQIYIIILILFWFLFHFLQRQIHPHYYKAQKQHVYIVCVLEEYFS